MKINPFKKKSKPFPATMDAFGIDLVNLLCQGYDQDTMPAIIPVDRNLVLVFADKGTEHIKLYAVQVRDLTSSAAISVAQEVTGKKIVHTDGSILQA